MALNLFFLTPLFSDNLDIIYNHIGRIIALRQARLKLKQRGKELTNFKIDKHNCYLANKGGRLRWKIENEGFNIQKNGRDITWSILTATIV